jgi:hypothetical protein
MRLKEWPWLAGLLSVGVAALWLAHGWLTAPVITNDSIQYLDAASSVASGGCLCVGVAHFDEQVAAGRLPVALTHFPPGYPLLIAGWSRLQPGLETAGYAISAIGFLLCILLIRDIGFTLGGNPLAISIAALLWILNSAALTYASAVLTESAFTAVVTAIVALVARDLKSERGNPRLLLAIGACAGLAYSLRYAGLFLIPPALLYLVWRWRRNRETMPWVFAGASAICCFVLPIQARNIVQMGSWRGVLLAGTSHNPVPAIVPTVVAWYWLLLGGHAFLSTGMWLGLVLVAGLTLPALAFSARRRGAFTIAAWIGLFGLAYTAGIVLSIISVANMNLVGRDLARYYLPLYPILLAGLAAAASRVRSTAWRAVMFLLAFAVLTSHARDLLAKPAPQERVVLADDLAKNVAPGESLRQWLLSHVPAGTTLVSEEGQTLHYVLQRPVVSIIEPPESSNRAADGPALRELMCRYKSRYLLLFPTIRVSRNRLPFLQDLILGKGPDWLKLSVGTDDVAAYECEACTK